MTVVPPPPLSMQERMWQARVDDKKKLTPIFNEKGEQVAKASESALRQIRKLQGPCGANAWHSAIRGNVMPAEAAFITGGDNWPLWDKKACELMKSGFYGALSLPALVAKAVYHLVTGRFAQLKENLADCAVAAKCIAVGFTKGVALSVGAPFHDGIVEAQRKSYEKKHKDPAVLLSIDSQFDFLDGTEGVGIRDRVYSFSKGALPVPGSCQALAHLARLEDAHRSNVRVLRSRDWHPENHGSFLATQRTEKADGTLSGKPQRLWAVHCVQGTRGAAFPNHILEKGFATIFKGQYPWVDSYSAYRDNDKERKTTLVAWLRQCGVQPGKGRVFVYGFATDYCAGWSAEDLCKEGYNVTMVVDASAGLDPKGTQEKLQALRAIGVEILTVDQAIGKYPKYFNQRQESRV